MWRHSRYDKYGALGRALKHKKVFFSVLILLLKILSVESDSPTVEPTAPTFQPVAAPTNYLIDTFAGNGVSGYSGDDDVASNCQLSTPGGIFMDSTGNLFIADSTNGVLRIVMSESGKIMTFAGGGMELGDNLIATGASLNWPVDVWGNSLGEIFIAEENAHYIRRIDGSSIISVFAGVGVASGAAKDANGDRGPASTASLSHPLSVCGDSLGYLFISDSTNNKVRMIDSNGIIVTIVGFGDSAYNFGEGDATAINISPFGIDIDSVGTLYMSDSAHRTILRSVIGSSFVSTIMGINGQCGFNGDGQAATSTTICYAISVRSDTVGNLYIADTANLRVRIMTSDDHLVYSIAGNGLSSAVLSGNGDAATSVPMFPTHLALAPRSVYVTCQSQNAVRVLYDISPTEEPTPTPSAVPSPAYNMYPYEIDNFAGLAPSPARSDDQGGSSGYSYYFPYSSTHSTYYSSGYYPSIPTTQYSPYGYGFPSYPTYYYLNQPTTAYYSSGSSPYFNLMPSEAPVVGSTYYNPNNGANYYYTPSPTLAPSTAPPTYPATEHPSIPTVTPTNTGMPSRKPSRQPTVKPSQLPTLTPTVVPTRTPSQKPTKVPSEIPTEVPTSSPSEASQYAGDGGQATAASFKQVCGVFQDASGNVFVVDYPDNRVRKVNVQGIISTFAGGAFSSTGAPASTGDNGPCTSAGLANPYGVWMDSLGSVFITEYGGCQVRMVDVSGIIYGFGGSQCPTTQSTTQSFDGDGGPATSAFLDGPTAAMGDSSGRIYVTDSSHNRVRVVSTDGIISTFAGVAGVSGFTGDDLPASSAGLADPEGLFVDREGNVYIADCLNNRVRFVSYTTGLMTTVAGNGDMFDDDGSAATSSAIVAVVSVWKDLDGVIFYLDGGLKLIKGVNPATTQVVDVAGSYSCSGYSGDGGLSTLACFQNPNSVWGNSLGNIFVSDNKNIRRLSVLIPTMAPSCQPSEVPSEAPTAPTEIPTVIPTETPTSTYSIISAVYVSSSSSDLTDPKTEIAVHVTLASDSDDAIVFCAAFLTTIETSGVVPFASSNDILSQNFNTESHQKDAVILIGGLIPASTYTVYCMTVSVQNSNVRTPYDLIIEGGGVLAVTQCCKIATVNAKVSTLLSKASTVSDSSALTIALSAYPTYTVDVSLVLFNRLTGATNPTMGTLSPSFFSLDSSYIPNTPIPIALTAGDAGQYGINVTFVGRSANEFQLNYTGYSTITIVAAPTVSPSQSPSEAPSLVPSEQPTVVPSHEPTVVPSLLPSVVPTIQPSLAPSVIPSTVLPSIRPSLRPTHSPSRIPSIAPSLFPTVAPTITPSECPSIAPSQKPSRTPSVDPSPYPSRVPTDRPSQSPSTDPSEGPTLIPSFVPTASPTCSPSALPSLGPSKSPTLEPTRDPSLCPSVAPSALPSLHPSVVPTIIPSVQATSLPSAFPSETPSLVPTRKPTQFPSFIPSVKPTRIPSFLPTKRPTLGPSLTPSVNPSAMPTVFPSVSAVPSISLQPTAPTRKPTSARPSLKPSRFPSVKPSVQPSLRPSKRPTLIPTTPTLSPTLPRPSISPSPTTEPSFSIAPSNEPTETPTVAPSVSPTLAPSTERPSLSPSEVPSAVPSVIPTMTVTVNPTTIAPSASPTTLDFFGSHPKATLPSNQSISVIGNDAQYFKIVLPFLSVVGGSSGVAFSDITLSYGSFGFTHILQGGSSVQSSPVSVSIGSLYESGVSVDSSKRSVSLLKDINGDGHDDVIIGDPYAEKCYIVFGNARGLTDMTSGFTIFGESEGDLTGWSVSSAGDVNNDTLSDIIIGAPFVNGVGAFYVIYGRRFNNFDVYLNNLTQSQGFAMYGTVNNDCLGISVSNAGDVNKDGFDDVIVGAVMTSAYYTGAAYLVFGGSYVKTLSSISLLQSNQGCKFTGAANMYVGYSVSGAGDVNKDGYDDVLIGSCPLNSKLVPTAYLVYGSASLASVSLSTLSYPQGVRITGGGIVVASVGDVNEDGYSDLLIGGSYTYVSDAGYVVFTNVSHLTQLTAKPSNMPSYLPTFAPTVRPTTRAPLAPSVVPTKKPSEYPTSRPTSPTFEPTVGVSQPSSRPSSHPTVPTIAPSETPSEAPTLMPSEAPTEKPTMSPTVEPSGKPSVDPTERPTMVPSLVRTCTPSTAIPTIELVSRAPFSAPTVVPTVRSSVYSNTYITGSMTLLSERLSQINYVVNATGDVTILNGHGFIKYTLSAVAGASLTIVYFNKTTDVIDLTSFVGITEYSQLLITEGSVLITLLNQQTIHILNLHPVDISASNFVFYQDQVLSNKVNAVVEDASKVVGLCVGFSVLGVIAWCLVRYYVYEKEMLKPIKDFPMFVLQKNIDGTDIESTGIVQPTVEMPDIESLDPDYIPSPVWSTSSGNSSAKLVVRSSPNAVVVPDHFVDPAALVKEESVDSVPEMERRMTVKVIKRRVSEYTHDRIERDDDSSTPMHSVNDNSSNELGSVSDVNSSVAVSDFSVNEEC